ncbi:MAG TPA: hypothetical protein VMB25_01860 [Bryobacteraceae bacterium]|nr:hypothetical protein [Bryobacteraceae bacterium]
MRRAILALCVSLGIAFGNWNDTSTGIDLDKLPHFPLTKVRSGWLKPGARVIFDGITAVATDSDVRLSAAGKSGKRWEVHTFGVDEVWRGDLDGNGAQDYVFFAGGPYGNGRTAPSFSLSILLRDRDAMPVPFFTVVYKGENRDGIKHLVGLSHDGRAELLISDYDELPSDAYVGPFCSGHWVNQLYRFNNLAVQEVRGVLGGIRFPLIHNWTDRALDCAEQQKPFSKVSPPVLINYQTSEPGLAATLRGPSGQLGFMAIEPVMGCKTIRADAVLYDEPKIRRVAFPNLSNDYSERLLNRIWKAQAHVELRGVTKSEQGECAVELLWAK